MERELREIDSIKPLIEYLQKNLKKGYKIDGLRWALIEQGHSRTAVDKAIKFVTELQEAQKLKKAEEKPEVLQTEQLETKVEEKKSFWQRIKSWFKREKQEK